MDQLITFIANLVFTTHQEVQKNGKTWLVVNGVPIVEGVLNGHLVPMDEFGAFAHDWNDISLVMRHPQTNEGTAKVPNSDVPNVGRFYRANLDKERRALTGEFWFNKDDLLATPDGKEVYDRIIANGMIEVSTGYFAQTEMTIGKFHDTPYIGIHRNIHPDHIAVLPNERGACSVTDGCGINRNTSIVQNCGQGCENCPAKQPKQQAVLPPKENKKMDIKEILTAFGNAFGAGKRKFTITSNVVDGKESFDLVVHDEGSVTTPAAQAAYTLPESLQALSDLLDRLGGVKQFESLFEKLPKLEEFANAAANVEKVKRDGLIAALVANTKLGMTAEELTTLPTIALEKMSVGFTKPAKGTGVNFAGLGTPAVLNANEDDEPAPVARPSFFLKKQEAVATPAKQPVA